MKQESPVNGPGWSRRPITLPKKIWKLTKLEFVKGTKNEGCRRPTFTIKVYPFCFFSAGCHHFSHPNAEGEGGLAEGEGGPAEGEGSSRGGGGLAEGEGGLAEREGGPAEGEGVWQSGRGSGRGGGGSARRGWLHSKVWTDTHINATGFKPLAAPRWPAKRPSTNFPQSSNLPSWTVIRERPTFSTTLGTGMNSQSLNKYYKSNVVCDSDTSSKSRTTTLSRWLNPRHWPLALRLFVRTRTLVLDEHSTWPFCFHLCWIALVFPWPTKVQNSSLGTHNKENNTLRFQQCCAVAKYYFLGPCAFVLWLLELDQSSGTLVLLHNTPWSFWLQWKELHCPCHAGVGRVLCW